MSNTKATIIAGPQSSGKTRIVEQITATYKSPHWMNAKEFHSKFEFSSMPEGTDLVLIDESIPSIKAMQRIKKWVSGGTVQVHRKNQPIIDVPCPHFVLITNGMPNLCLSDTDRRFAVISC